MLNSLSQNESLSSCDHCLVGKRHRVSFSSRSNKLEKLELVYSNVYDPIDVKTLRRNIYFVTFIEDVTRKI